MSIHLQSAIVVSEMTCANQKLHYFNEKIIEILSFRSVFWILIFAVRAFHTYWMWKIAAVRKQLVTNIIRYHKQAYSNNIEKKTKISLKRNERNNFINTHLHFIICYQCIRANRENGCRFSKAMTSAWRLCLSDSCWIPETIQSYGVDRRKRRWFNSL